MLFVEVGCGIRVEPACQVHLVFVQTADVLYGEVGQLGQGEI